VRACVRACVHVYWGQGTVSASCLCFTELRRFKHHLLRALLPPPPLHQQGTACPSLHMESAPGAVDLSNCSCIQGYIRSASLNDSSPLSPPPPPSTPLPATTSISSDNTSQESFDVCQPVSRQTLTTEQAEQVFLYLCCIFGVVRLAVGTSLARPLTYLLDGMTLCSTSPLSPPLQAALSISTAVAAVIAGNVALAVATSVAGAVAVRRGGRGGGGRRGVVLLRSIILRITVAQEEGCVIVVAFVVVTSLYFVQGSVASAAGGGVAGSGV